MIITERCQYCNKKIEIAEEKFLAAINRYQQKYSCGHIALSAAPLIPPAKDEVGDFTSLDGRKKAHGYQEVCVRFVEESGINCLNADAIGAGKTIETLLPLRRNWEQVIPILLVLKSATLYQWSEEFREWCSPEFICHIHGSNALIVPGFPVYMISHDLLGRKGMKERLLTLGIKTIVVDECHAFKDPGAKRTVALVEFIKEAGITQKIFISGTPIKNRADEYFTVLNLLSPRHFPFRKHFVTRWLIPDSTGKFTRLNPRREAEFRELTSRWIIRRERRELDQDLPPFKRNFIYREINDEVMKKAYNDEVDLLEEYLAGKKGKPTPIETLGKLARLRRITANAKIGECREFAEEFLENIEDDKLLIGVHHESVRDSLFYGLSKYGSLKLSGEDNTDAKYTAQHKFNNSPHHRVLVCNMLAGGVGLNLHQSCCNAIVLERQWNFVDEKQFEGRIFRDGQKRPVTIDYLLAAHTVDEYFTKMVERKRVNFRTTMGDDFENKDGEDDYQFENDTKGIFELAEEVTRNRL